jgi:hypothetical protein
MLEIVIEDGLVWTFMAARNLTGRGRYANPNGRNDPSFFVTAF